jgi:hypothetical protein
MPGLDARVIVTMARATDADRHAVGASAGWRGGTSLRTAAIGCIWPNKNGSPALLLLGRNLSDYGIKKGHASTRGKESTCPCLLDLDVSLNCGHLEWRHDDTIMLH